MVRLTVLQHVLLILIELRVVLVAVVPIVAVAAVHLLDYGLRDMILRGRLRRTGRRR